jgi:hypothetical protein
MGLHPCRAHVSTPAGFLQVEGMFTTLSGRIQTSWGCLKNSLVV